MLQDMGDLVGARAAYERALAILRTTYGEDHPEVAKVHSNLGLVLYALGDTTSARAAFERALTADERAFGPDHPDVARDINNLGLVLQELGDMPGARAAYERALAIDEMVFGPDHPDVALRVNNLGGVLQHLGDLRAARAAYERALAILRTTYGEDHPEVAKVHSNLGSVLEQLGDMPGARAAYERALAIDEKAFGPDHPDVALRFNNLGLVLQSLGDLDGARTAFERALAIFTRVHDEHNAQAVRENLLKVQGKYGSESTTLRVSQQIPIGDVTWSFGITIGRSPSGFRHGIGIRELDELFLPVINVVTATKSRKKGNPLRIIDLLKTELAKGPARNDNAVAAAIDQLVTVVPDSRDALIEIFETPVVAANIGPVTKFVIAKIRQI